MYHKFDNANKQLQFLEQIIYIDIMEYAQPWLGILKIETAYLHNMNFNFPKIFSSLFKVQKREIYGNRIVSQTEIKFLDYSFPCLNSFSENNIKKLLAIQNTAVRSILKLKYDTPFNIVHHEAFNKLKLLTVSHRLFELTERYVGTGLSHSIPLVVRLVKEYKEGFQSRYIEYPTPLSK
ncbi:hypothetical protein BpHYR1_028493 [Brachionus plicatilis]|uniref:RNA-directed DNA polymerase from mobile element jockey-like n=1 Tax=Brachionus plicatilis TaxID=10195 RepID=A0A3M7T6T0_BRAPC|nr:hypothetical protein BpHYR1_028493 [Brachionus plicatilis]